MTLKDDLDGALKDTHMAGQRYGLKLAQEFILRRSLNLQASGRESQSALFRELVEDIKKLTADPASFSSDGDKNSDLA